jgi:dTDP-4-dehydrorhamnose 3,5-epimerase
VNFRESSLAGVFMVEGQTTSDERGSFTRLFDREEFSGRGLDVMVDHVASSLNTRRGTLRGIHYQSRPNGQSKLVRCAAGSLFDVVVDVRPESQTYLSWAAFDLRAGDGLAVYIPNGCAHGFLTLEDATEVIYQISAPRRPEAERGLRWDDPALRIAWPSAPAVISDRDRGFPLLKHP